MTPGHRRNSAPAPQVVKNQTAVKPATDSSPPCLSFAARKKPSKKKKNTAIRAPSRSRLAAPVSLTVAVASR